LKRSTRSIGVYIGIGLLAVAVAAFAAITLNRASSRDAFIGDSITEQWMFPRVNNGIYGQTSAQILARFPTQIFNRGYSKVFILAGSNDVLLGIDPATTIRNIDAMATLTQQAHAEPILAEIPPIFRDNGQYAPAVDGLNARIATLAATRSLKFIDYNTALRDHPNDYADGVHFKRRGYLRMELALLHTTNPF